MTDAGLSAAVVAHLEGGAPATPAVAAIVAESLDVPVDWGSLSLGDAGRAMAAEMAGRHPELDRPALDALARNFTFTWR